MNQRNDLKFKPVKDTILILISILLIVFIVLLTFFLQPKKVSSHVEIRYQNTLLWDKEDSSKSTAIAFPSEGEKKITYRQEDSSLFLKEGKFLFEHPITFTLYADCSIQILEEDITCPDHTCVHLGRIYQSYVPLVCLPNQIQAMIINDGYPERVN